MAMERHELLARYGGEHGITVIDGGCQLMFEPMVGGARKVMRFLVKP
jgi:hypothetical protein